MQQPARYVLVVIGATLVAVAGILLLRHRLNGEELALVLPCVLAGLGVALLGFGLFLPLGMVAQDQCSPSGGNDEAIEDLSVGSVDASEP